MSVKTKKLLWVVGLLLLIIAIYQAYPYLLFKVMEWQREFNLQISASLRALNENSHQAGIWLMLISFIYGVFHAVGPGHGKFILGTYLSLETTKIPKTIKITLLAAIFQGLVAVGLVTLLVVVLTLSRQHFNLTLTWVERGSFIMMILFGCYWIFQSIRSVWKNLAKKKEIIKPIKINKIQSIQQPMAYTAKLATDHVHSEHCGCGHKHLPSSEEMENIQDWKSMMMVIVSIGLRPCTGAVLVLFLAYTVDLYMWGVASALVMALGTGLTLTLFALFVLFSRNKAIETSRWYFSMHTNKQLVVGIKVMMGIFLIGFGTMLFHGSLIDTTTLLFGGR